jgi:hypothetical protein
MNIDLNDINRHPQTVDEALVVLETVSARFRAQNDPRAVFPDMYAVITRNVAKIVNDPQSSFFYEPQWISRLSGRFCEIYFETLLASMQGLPVPSVAWLRSFEYGRLGVTWPVQDAVLGLTSHITYDLAQGLESTIRDAGHQRNAEQLARYRHDHDAVNTILKASVPEIIELLATRYSCRATRIAISLPGGRRMSAGLVLAAVFSWRAHVWDDLLELLATEDAAAHTAILRRMDRRAGRLTQMIGDPLGLHTPSDQRPSWDRALPV